MYLKDSLKLLLDKKRQLKKKTITSSLPGQRKNDRLLSNTKERWKGTFTKF